MERQAVPRDDDSLALNYRRLLGARLYVHCGVRAIVAATIVVAAFFAHYVLGMEGLDLGALTALALFIGVYNVVPWFLSRPFRVPGCAAPDYRRVLALSYGTVVLDFLSLTCAIWLVGGCRSPFIALYLVHVIVSTVLLPRRDALALTTLAYALLTLLVLVEWAGLAPPRLPAGAIAGSGPLEGRFALTVLVVNGTLFGLTVFLLLGLTGALRSGERRIHLANTELERLSEQRRDFLQIAMHNLKAPLGAVTMFLENMKAELAGPITDTQREWLGRSLARLSGLMEFLAEMQTLSSLENTIITSTFERVELARVLEPLVEEYQDVARSRGLELRLEVERAVPPVVGHERLLREAIVNYITNAIKYAREGGHILVRLSYPKPSVRVEVIDDGEGITAEDQGQLFGEFVRVVKPGSKSAGVKGTGLGLSIVKRIALAHDGLVGVKSGEGGGATFFIDLPPLIA